MLIASEKKKYSFFVLKNSNNKIRKTAKTTNFKDKKRHPEKLFSI